MGVSLLTLLFYIFFIIYTRSSINVIFSSSLHSLKDPKSFKWNASHTFPPSMPHFSQDFTYLKASCPFSDSTLSVSVGTFEYKE